VQRTGLRPEGTGCVCWQWFWFAKESRRFALLPTCTTKWREPYRWAVSDVEQYGDINKQLFKLEGVINMNNPHSPRKGYALAVILGAIGGGLFVAIATKAVPRMMSGMMQNMMVQMRKNGFNPGEM
jgi:hypothetical protein